MKTIILCNCKPFAFVIMNIKVVTVHARGINKCIQDDNLFRQSS